MMSVEIAIPGIAARTRPTRSKISVEGISRGHRREYPVGTDCSGKMQVRLDLDSRRHRVNYLMRHVDSDR